MIALINNLLNINKILFSLLESFLILFIKNPIVPKSHKPVNKPYRKIEVDDMPPIVENNKSYDYQVLLKEYKLKHGKPLKPINRRKKSNISSSTYCPYCGAPKEYLYENNGSNGQLLCKVCDNTFVPNSKPKKSVTFRCPYCGYTLEKIKDRSNFSIYKCKNNDCDYFIKKFNSMSSKDKELYNKDPGKFKLRYIYRDYNFTLENLASNTPNSPKIDINRAHNSLTTIGYILTFYVNYGLSSREVSSVMKDVFNVSVSHQTVLNYAQAAAYYLSDFTKDKVENISDILCGDETYIKIKGKWRYIFLILDPVNKIIVSNFISKNRDTFSACSAIKSALDCFSKLPENLTFVFDGNPIYQLAKYFYSKHGINFDIKTVVGLTNNDIISTEYRPYKQFIERLNRTFKDNYRHTNGFGSFDGAITYVTLFTAWFNFLRPHSVLDNEVPIHLKELDRYANMPTKWAKLIELSQLHAIEKEKEKVFSEAAA